LKKTAILNYGSGNIFSIGNALGYINADSEVISSPTEMDRFDQFIVPGVGAFAACMKMLNDTGLAQGILCQAAMGKKILGICVGMQVLFDRSFEFGCHDGIGLFAGDVVQLPVVDDLGDQLITPHVGWAPLTLKPPDQISSPSLAIFDEMEASNEFYFVHSFMAVPAEEKLRLAEAKYGRTPLVAAVGAGNVIGLQFHPEKSGQAGLELLRRWIDA
jgi:glutamine amidotransferase